MYPNNSIERMERPDFEGLPPLVVALHASLVHLELMRKSIDRLGVQLERSQCAVCESEALLDRLRKDGL
jgi:hypothetical protein